MADETASGAPRANTDFAPSGTASGDSRYSPWGIDQLYVQALQGVVQAINALNAPISNAFQKISGLSVLGNSGTTAASSFPLTGTAGQVLRVNHQGTSLGFGAIDDQSTVIGQQGVTNPAGAFYNPLYFGNPGTGVVDRVNRLKVGLATLSTSDTPLTTGTWLDTLFGTSISPAQLEVFGAISSSTITAASRSSDFPTWDGLGNHTGGAGNNFFGYNDDITGGNPIAYGLNAVGIVRATQTATVTITIASPGVITWTAHGFFAGVAVVFTTTGTLPTGITAGTTYYVISAGLTANNFEISATQGGAAISTSGSQSGTHTGTVSLAGAITLGAQLDLNNKGPVADVTPFSGIIGASTTSLLCTPGAYSALSGNNVSAGIIIGAGQGKYRRGIVFQSTALDTTVGQAGQGVAIEMARAQSIRWQNSTPGIDVEMWGTASGQLNINSGTPASVGSVLSMNTFLFLASDSTGAVTPYNRIYDSAGNITIFLGGGGGTPDHTNYYRNTTHQFADIAGANFSTNIDVNGLNLLLGKTTPAGGSTGLGIRMGTAVMNITWGSGAPTLSAAQGSLYLRTDGSSTSTRAYINTNGSTTWTAITTAA
jgi:hypothetical protein